jgi:excisionase family DNA binding protein
MTISIEEKKGNAGRPHSGYMTTTEVAKLCGVSRFTLINWVNQGKIKVIRTIGKHCRIPVSEALSLLKSSHEKKKMAASDLSGQSRQQAPTTSGDEECGNCLTGNVKDKQVKAKKKSFLYAFGYGIGRGAHILKGRSKVK